MEGCQSSLLLTPEALSEVSCAQLGRGIGFGANGSGYGGRGTGHAAELMWQAERLPRQLGCNATHVRT